MADEKRKYTVKSPLKFGGTRHEPGAEVEMTDADAAQAVSAGAIEPVDANNDGKADKAKKAKP